MAIFHYHMIATIFIAHLTVSLSIVCPRTEKQALLRFKQDLVDPTNRLASWVAGEEDCCTWFGVVCNNETGHVEELGLSSKGSDFEAKLRGKINPSLLYLKHLTRLDLSENDFRGSSIPSFIGSLVTLTHLDLNFASFQGLIPYQLGNLSSLRYLSVSGFGLHVKNLHWLTRLSSLEHLEMSFVNLTEPIDHWSSINTLGSLLELRLSNCESLRFIPPISHVNFTSLEVLDLSFIIFHFSSSSLFKWLSSLTKLVSLNLDATGIGTQGPPILCGLKNMTLLKTVDLSNNEFNSSIPTCLYGLSNLEQLFLGGNRLRGVITSAIKNLTSITSLNLEFNALEGKPPSSMGSLSNLETLVLRGNRFDGNISDAFASLLGWENNPSSLISLSLSQNFFSGQIADRIIGEFKNLEELYLDGNAISGPIPAALGNLSSLEMLVIDRNRFNGSIPKSLGALSNLQHLLISENHLGGVVSEDHFVKLKNLRDFRASRNSLTLRVSPDWSPPFQLRTLDLSDWNLGPHFPAWLESQDEVYYLDLSNTNISDAIPSWFSDVPAKFEYLNLSHNLLRGEIPNLRVISLFCEIYLNSNKFEGSLPRISSDVLVLDLSNNSLSGDISHLLCNPISDRARNRLQILHLGGNLLSGKIPDCWMYWPELMVINFSSNNITGEIPSSIRSLSDLSSLHLRNNSLSGEIPLSLRNCTELIVIDLGLNKLEGNIPLWIGTSLLGLRILSLRANKFSGNIPSELCRLSSLQILDASQNHLSGAVPRCFDNFTAMATKPSSSQFISYILSYGNLLENAFVVTRGREDQYSTILGLMVSLDLSGNDLSGDFPEQLTSLSGLFSLNLSANHLGGKIPATIGGLTSAQSLDFSRNEFAGEIPRSVSGLNFLSIFNVSYNNLSGEIPPSTQIQSMEASNFAGNRFLCGPPLANACEAGDNETKPSADHNELKDGDEEEEHWLYWFRLGIEIGFGVGFFGVIIPLIMYPTWRRFYFSMLQRMWYKTLEFFLF